MNANHLRPSEAATLLDVSDRTIRRWIATGVLRADRVVSRYRVPRSEIARLLGGTPAQLTTSAPARRSRRAVAA